MKTEPFSIIITALRGRTVFSDLLRGVGITEVSYFDVTVIHCLQITHSSLRPLPQSIYGRKLRGLAARFAGENLCVPNSIARR